MLQISAASEGPTYMGGTVRYAPDRHAEFNGYAQRRMRDEFKELHVSALKLGDEMRQTCGPSEPKSISGRIADRIPPGTSQAGAPTPPAPRDVEVIGLCVAKLRAIERCVFDCEYVWCVGADILTKLQWLRRNRKIDVSKTQYKHKLMVMRERLSMGYSILF